MATRDIVVIGGSSGGLDDVSDSAIEQARTGTYPVNIGADVSIVCRNVALKSRGYLML